MPERICEDGKKEAGKRAHGNAGKRRDGVGFTRVGATSSCLYLSSSTDSLAQLTPLLSPSSSFPRIQWNFYSRARSLQGEEPNPTARATSGESIFLTNLNGLGNPSSVLQRTVVYTASRDHKYRRHWDAGFSEAGLQSFRVHWTFFVVVEGNSKYPGILKKLE